MCMESHRPWRRSGREGREQEERDRCLLDGRPDQQAKWRCHSRSGGQWPRRGVFRGRQAELRSLFGTSWAGGSVRTECAERTPARWPCPEARGRESAQPRRRRHLRRESVSIFKESAACPLPLGKSLLCFPSEGQEVVHGRSQGAIPAVTFNTTFHLVPRPVLPSRPPLSGRPAVAPGWRAVHGSHHRAGHHWRTESTARQRRKPAPVQETMLLSHP